MPNLNIKKLSLRDYRCFESIDIEFHEQLTVLVASNGVGKTSILDAVAVAFGPYIGAFDEATGKHFEPSDIRLGRVRETSSNEMEYAAMGVRLEATGWIPDSPFSRLNHPTMWMRSLSGPVGFKTTIKDAKDLIEYGKRQQASVRTPGGNTVLPLLAYYGTGRLWLQRHLTKGKLPSTSRTIGYADCLDPASSYKSFVEWFRYWSTNAFKERIVASEAGRSYEPTEFDNYIASVSGAVNACLKPAGWKDIAYSLSREELMARHDQHGELPVALLSDGIRNMIGMVADIAFRATKLNSPLGASAVLETPGIVLIDEVDMHLHPEWQQVVLQSLTTAFPKVQFIVTTHSPQVLSTVRRESIRVIRKTDTGYEALMPVMSPLAREAGDALAYVMDTHTVPQIPLLEDVHAYEQLVRAGREDSEAGRKALQRLDTAGYEIPESDLAAWRFLSSRRVPSAG